MKPIQEKFNNYKLQAQNGDIILFRGTGIIAKLIQYFDKAYFNHIGIVYCPTGDNNQLMILDENGNGAHPDYLELRIEGYEDFGIIRPVYSKSLMHNITSKDINNALTYLFNTSQFGIKYNFGRLLEIAIFRKTGKQFKFLDNPHRDICSEFVQLYTSELDILCFNNSLFQLITPMDFYRSMSNIECMTMFINPELTAKK